MKRHKLLGHRYCSGSLRWTQGGEQTGSVSYTVTENAMRLSYRTRSYSDDEWTPIEENIQFGRTPTAFGGRRRWFVCPSCLRNCRILYGGARFRCRECHRLTYESQYEPPWGRAINKAEKVRMKLGGTGSMDEAFPPKPKGMHWRTYWRLEEQDDMAEAQWAALLINWMDRTALGGK